MKTLILFALTILVTFNSPAQTGTYEDMLGDALSLLDSVRTITDVQKGTAMLERIAQVEDGRWESFYHLAYCRIIQSFMEDNGNSKDALLDEAQKDIDRSIYLNGDKSELYALQGLLYQGRIQVNILTRGMSYSQKAAEMFDNSLRENPHNPRAHFLMGQNIENTPAMFGGGCKNALSHYEKSVEAFMNEENAGSANPAWGRSLAISKVEKCSEEN